MTSLRNIEPKLVVKLQPFGTERDMIQGVRLASLAYSLIEHTSEIINNGSKARFKHSYVVYNIWFKLAS